MMLYGSSCNLTGGNQSFLYSSDRRQAIFVDFLQKKTTHFFLLLYLGAMAELGLALPAVPGSTVELFKLAKLAVERIKCFRHTSSFLNKLKAFGYDLCDGQLYLAVQLVENFVTDDRSRNGKLESLAKKHLEKLRTGLIEAQGILEKSVDVDGHVNGGIIP